MRFTQNGFMEDSRPTHYDREPSWLSAFAEVVLMIAISITTVLVVACGISFLRAVIAVINGMFP